MLKKKLAGPGPVCIFAVFLSCFMLPCSPTVHAADIIAFGDSITQGSIDPAGSDNGGYPLVLQQIYDNNGLDVHVYNKGLAGERTSDGLSRISSVLNETSADFLLLLEGANDVIAGISHQTLVQNLGLMIDKCQAKGVSPLLATMTPDEKYGNTSLINATINPEIKTLATEKNVTLVDLYSVVADSWAAWSWDGLHPNYDGMSAIAYAWYGYVPISGAGSGGGAASGGDDGGGGGCFIATASYGSLLEPQVVLLQNFRDQFLLTNRPGSFFVAQYYKYSPPLADYIAAHPWLRAVTRIFLYPLVGVSAILLSPARHLFIWSLLAGLMLILFFCYRQSGRERALAKAYDPAGSGYTGRKR